MNATASNSPASPATSAAASPAQEAVRRLLDRLTGTSVPAPLISQFLPTLYPRVAGGPLDVDQTAAHFGPHPIAGASLDNDRAARHLSSEVPADRPFHPNHARGHPASDAV